MPQVILYLLIGIFLFFKMLVKWVFRGTQSSNPYLRNGLRVVMVLTILFSLFYALYVYQRRDINSFEKLVQEPSIEKYQEFVNDYPDSEKASEARNWINEQYEHELQSANDSLSLSNFIDRYSNNYRYKEEYKSIFINRAVEKLNLEKKRLEYERNERMKREQQDWNSESRAWQTATLKATLAIYQQYLKLYPNGAHKSEAKKKIIDLEVADVFRSGDYGQLPSMGKTDYGESSYSTVTISNDTEYILTLLYSGVESKRVAISPHETQNINLKSASYRIVASVNDGSVRNFAGTEDLLGGSYSVNYYISTTKR